MTVQAFEWLQAMLRISLAPALPEGNPLPQIICYDELETMDTMMWLGMQNLIIVNDRCQSVTGHAVAHITIGGTGTEAEKSPLSCSKRSLLFPWQHSSMPLALAALHANQVLLRAVVCLCHTCHTALDIPSHPVSIACRYTHPEGRGGFASVDHGQQFREAAYKEAGLTRPSPWALGGAPRTITLLSAVLGEMVGLLWKFLLMRNLNSSMRERALLFSAKWQYLHALPVAANQL